jgi:hypothetical protein|uniref:Uncharacterized protein n=1 Tax=uncultured microorganism TaxID=358574 RepID=A0A1L3KS76_9ZZZZ|nr:hypothetical protein [uncultured microorganism]
MDEKELQAKEQAFNEAIEYENELTDKISHLWNILRQLRSDFKQAKIAAGHAAIKTNQAQREYQDALNTFIHENRPEIATERVKENTPSDNPQEKPEAQE